MIHIHPITPEHIAEVLKVQHLCYKPELNETSPAFLKKQTLFPKGCLGAWEDGQLCGYVFSHPWRVGEIVPLHTDSYAIPTDADCLYIHDLAVDPNYRSKMIGQAILKSLFDIAAEDRWTIFALVAVQDSEPFWSRWGFEPQKGFEYVPGVKATYMVCRGFPFFKPHC